METMEMVESVEPDAEAEQAAPAESLAVLLARHERERSAALAQISAERRAADQATTEAIRADAVAGVARVIGELRAERGRNGLYAVPIYGAPREASELERIAAEAGPDERAALVIVPRADAYGDQRRTAWAFVDVSSEVWG